MIVITEDKKQDGYSDLVVQSIYRAAEGGEDEAIDYIALFNLSAEEVEYIVTSIRSDFERWRSDDFPCLLKGNSKGAGMYIHLSCSDGFIFDNWCKAFSADGVKDVFLIFDVICDDDNNRYYFLSAYDEVDGEKLLLGVLCNDNILDLSLESIATALILLLPSLRIGGDSSDGE